MSPAIKFDQAIKEAGNERVILSPRAKHPYVCIYTPRRVNKSTVWANNPHGICFI